MPISSRTRNTVFTLLTTAILTSGCSSNPATSTTDKATQNSAASATHYLSSNQCFELKTNLLERAQVNTFFEFEFELAKSCVAKEEIDNIVFLADMPAHRHGMNTTPTVKNRTNNHYVVQGTLLHMPGAWKARFEIYYDAKIEIIELDLDL